MTKAKFHSNAPIIADSRNYLKRPHISELLWQGLKGPLITVVAGAGYGKTQAVYSLLRSRDVIATWIQLTERDNLASRFWENYTHTISRHNEKHAAKLMEIGFPETESQFDRYLETLEDSISPARKYVLVFDDFHLIQNPALLAFIERVVFLRFHNSAGNMATIIISRTAPAINTVKLDARGLFLEINEDDLRFTKEEIADYLNILGVNPTPEALSDIHRNTGGWAFAVNLIGLFLKHTPAQENLAISAMKLNIFKLIESEVFLAISEDLRDFLIRLSLIDNLPFPLTKRLAGDNENLLAEMEGISSFIRYDAYLNVFRIHRLFLDYLAQKQKSLSAEETRSVYRAAARWFEENGRKIDAMAYYEKAEDYPAIVAIAYMYPQVLPADTALFILALLEKGMDALFRDNPIFYALYTRLLMSAGRSKEAVDKLNVTIEAFEKMPLSKFNCRVLMSSYINLGFANMILCPLTGNYDFVHCFKKADYYCTKGAPFGDYAVRGPVTSITMGAYSCRVGSAAGDDTERYIEALDLVVPYAVNTMDGCMYGQNDLARAEIAYFRGAVKDAEKFAYQALYKSRERRQRELESRALFYLIRVDIQAGDYGKTQQHLKSIESLTELAEYPLSPDAYDTATGWYHAQLGQISRIPDWLKGGFDDITMPPFMIGFETLVRARCYWADKKYHELLAYLESRQTEGAILLIRLEFKILEALCLYQINEKTGAFEALRAAYALSRSNGFDMMFVEYGNKMRTLSRAAIKAACCGLPTDWLTKINKKSATYAKKLTFIVSEYRKANHLGDDIHLSPREIEILTDLCHGLSRAEIADNRRLSINTVKSLLQIIYAKLGAENNMDVMRIALDMKLIG
jgi:LuxR family maltose regulon positive regulatory protein